MQHLHSTQVRPAAQTGIVGCSVAAVVVHVLLSWIGAADIAHPDNTDKPPLIMNVGSSIVPEGDEWLLTELEQRRTP